MIDSNTLNQLGATLRHQAEIDRGYGENIAAGPWAALRLGMRMDADAKRRDIDFINAHKDAVLMEQAKGALAGPQGAALLDKERRAQFGADPNVDRSPAVVKDQLFYNDAPSVEELKRLNPELSISDGNWEYIRQNWGKGQGTNYAWSTATGKVYKKPEAKELEEADLYSLLSEKDKDNESLYRYSERQVPKDEESIYKEWYAKKFGGETEEERKKREEELFNADYENKFRQLFGSDEDMQRFRNLSEDPRLTRFDPELGRRVLKRDDELYFDLGNYDQYMAPEMAPPYFQRANELLGLNKDRWERTLNALDKKVNQYETLAQNSRREQNEINYLIAQGNANIKEAMLSGDTAKAKEYRQAVRELKTRMGSLQKDEYYNREMARVSAEKSEEIRTKGPLSFMSAPYAGQKFLSGLYSQDVLDQIGMTADPDKMDRPHGPLARGVGEAPMAQSAADAARGLYGFTGEGAGGQFARTNKQFAPVGALAPAGRVALNQDELGFDKRKYRWGTEGWGPNQPYSKMAVGGLFNLTDPSTYFGQLININSLQRAGMTTGEIRAALGGLGGLGGKDAASRTLDEDQLGQASVPHLTRYVENLAYRNPEMRPSEDYKLKYNTYLAASQAAAFKSSTGHNPTKGDLMFINKAKDEFLKAYEKAYGKEARAEVEADMFGEGEE